MNKLINALDKTDIAILAILQKDGAISAAQVAERVSLSVTPCWRRMKRLEREGFVTGYQANLSRRKVGLDVLAFVEVSFVQASDPMASKFETRMLAEQAVLTCHKITGRADYLLQVVAQDLDAYNHFVETVLRTVKGVGVIHSSLAMHEIKATSRLPLVGFD